MPANELVRFAEAQPSLYKTGSAEEGGFDRICMNKFGGASAIKASFIAFGLHKFSENRIFTDADDYSIEIELPLAD